MKKAIGIILCLAVLICASIVGVRTYSGQKIKKLEETVSPIPETVKALPVTENELCYAFDVFDAKKLVGFVDYVFVAKVEEITGTVYESVVYDRKAGTYTGTPYTCYKITVVENIKGNLKLNETIPMRSLGGVSVDGKSYYKYGQGDELEIGRYYLFLGYADQNGELYVCDTNATIALEFSQSIKSGTIQTQNSAPDALLEKNSDLINKYKDAFQNQDLSVRAGERYSSKYDA